MDIKCSTAIEIEKGRPREDSQNLQHFLFDRESGHYRGNVRGGPSARLWFERQLHKSITPNLTIQNVDKPHGYIRKFTPDGRLLLSFSQDQRSLEVYEYRGVGRAADLLQHIHEECITAADHSLDSLRVRQQVYDRMFKLRWNIRLVPDAVTRCNLNREFSIFLENGRYVLLAAMAKNSASMPVSHIFEYPDLFDDLELFDYTFFLVNLHEGRVYDIQAFRCDSIMLSHNHGVSAYGYTIAILFKCRQCIQLLELVGDRLVPLGCIGVQECVDNFEVVEFDCRILSHLKQRILSNIYRDILTVECKKLRTMRLKEFYKNFPIYERMIMTKMQLIDANHLLIRYEDRPPPLGMEASMGDDKNEFKLYVFYAISEMQVLKVYPKNSIELLYLLRNFCDNFRNVRSLQTQRPSSSPSNNIYFRAAFNSAIVSIPGGQTEAALRFNPTLPISTQSCATTQYLDYSLFNYDDRLISALERPKISSPEPIRFSDRDTNITKFRLFLEPPCNKVLGEEGPTITTRELVAFVFHPFEPFIISVQKLSTRYVVNFHIYNECTVVKQ